MLQSLPLPRVLSAPTLTNGTIRAADDPMTADAPNHIAQVVTMGSARATCHS